MRSTWRIPTLSVLALLGALTLAAFRSSAPPAARWEYLTLWDQTDTATLNGLGREGWELVGLSTASMQGTTGREVGWLFFKRPVAP